MITTQYSQSLIDIAIQHYGNAQAAVQLALLNGIDVSEELAAGDSLIELDAAYELKPFKELKINQSVEEKVLTVEPNQSVLDIAIQYAGSAQAAVLIAIENGISVSDQIEAGKELTNTRVPMFSKSVTQNFIRSGMSVATDEEIVYTFGSRNVFELGVFELNVFE